MYCSVHSICASVTDNRFEKTFTITITNIKFIYVVVAEITIIVTVIKHTSKVKKLFCLHCNRKSPKKGKNIANVSNITLKFSFTII